MFLVFAFSVGSMFYFEPYGFNTTFGENGLLVNKNGHIFKQHGFADLFV